MKFLAGGTFCLQFSCVCSKTLILCFCGNQLKVTLNPGKHKTQEIRLTHSKCGFLYKKDFGKPFKIRTYQHFKI
jgi:hypothetical protein